MIQRSQKRSFAIPMLDDIAQPQNKPETVTMPSLVFERILSFNLVSPWLRMN